MNETRQLAAYAANLRTEQLSDEVIGYAKVLLLDLLGAALYGSVTEVARVVGEVGRARYRPGSAALWGHDEALHPAGAALVNGTQAHAFELDDYHPGAKLHPGAVVVPAALAAASQEGASGVDLLAALVAGYDAMIRVSLAADSKSVRRRGWHLTGLAGPFGAAVAAGRLYDLSERQMLHALGIAGSQSSGLFAFSEEGAMTKRLHAGRAAESGLLAAELAASGFTGPSRVLEAEDGGFLRAVSDEPRPERLVEGLGERFELLNASIKPYSCCGSLHSSIDAVIQLVEEHGLDPLDIREIVAKNSSVVDQQCGFTYHGRDALEAQMSLQYCLAVAAVDRAAFMPQFSPERVSEPRLLDLAGRVRFVLDPEIEEIYPRQFPARVEISTRDGRSFERYVPAPKGSAVNRYSMAEAETKLRAVTHDLLDDAEVERIVGEVEDLENAGEVDGLLEVLSSVRLGQVSG